MISQQKPARLSADSVANCKPGTAPVHGPAGVSPATDRRAIVAGLAAKPMDDPPLPSLRPPTDLPLRKRLPVLAALLLLALSGCGQKGELYLPERERAELDAERR